MNRAQDAWLVDLDGTLYEARPGKLCMLAELSLGGWSALGTLRRFRVEHERLRQTTQPLGDPYGLQLERAAQARARSGRIPERGGTPGHRARAPPRAGRSPRRRRRAARRAGMAFRDVV